jgi:hypothetical protein
MSLVSLAQLRQLIRTLSYVVSTHAADELEDDNLTILDLENIVLSGQIVERQRDRRQWMYIGVASLVGGVIGFFTGFFDQGDGRLFGGDFAQLKLPPALAIVVAILVVVGLIILPLSGFRMIDDYKREQNFVGFTGGCIAVLGGYPLWAVLHAGGFVPAPHAFGIFAIAFVSMIVAFLYARWRL